MKPAMLALFAIIGLAVLTAALVIARPGQVDNAPQLKITTDRNVYTLAMSSTVGIGLTPDYPSSINNSTVSFRWQTGYGHFLSWGDSHVTELGPDVTIGDGKIYWSYLWENGSSQRPPVHITLTMIDKATGAAINSTGLDIGWGEWDTAVVKP